MTMSSHRTRIARLLAVVALAFGLLVGVPAAASALPPDGPGPETPGTKSKVWPKKVKAGERLNFEVWGFPANETVYIKIDDGNMCKDTSHGACVYHTQKLDKKGHAKGSLVVPNLGAGKHWLRMLATGDVFDSKTGEKIGYKGYSRRGGNTFTVVAGGASDKSPGGAGGAAANADGTIEGGSVEIDLGEESPSPEPTVPPTETATPEQTASETPVSESPVSESPTPAAAPPANPAPPVPPAAAAPVPVAGIAALAGAVVVGGGAVGWALVRRNRLVKLAAAGEG